MIFLFPKLKGFQVRTFLKSLGKTMIATTVMVLALVLSGHLDINVKLLTVIQISLGAATFFATAAIIKAPEIGSIQYILDRILKKS